MEHMELTTFEHWRFFIDGFLLGKGLNGLDKESYLLLNNLLNDAILNQIARVVEENKPDESSKEDISDILKLKTEVAESLKMLRDEQKEHEKNDF